MLMRLCIDCRHYVPDTTILFSKPNPRWAECAHLASLEPVAPAPSPVDGSIAPQRRMRCIEARIDPRPGLCGPEGLHWQAKGL